MGDGRGPAGCGASVVEVGDALPLEHPAITRPPTATATTTRPRTGRQYQAPPDRPDQGGPSRLTPLTPLTPLTRDGGSPGSPGTVEDADQFDVLGHGEQVEPAQRPDGPPGLEHDAQIPGE